MRVYDALKLVLAAVERNHSKLRAEPDSDGASHDKWEEEEEALTDLEESLEEAIEQYENAIEVRRSLRTMVLNN